MAIEQEKSTHPAVLNGLKSWKIIFPIAIGLGATAYLFWREYTPGSFDGVTFSVGTVLFLLLAYGCMSMRDIGYMLRIRILSEKDLSWRQAFRVIMLWEFASAVTPSAVGGTSVAVFFVNREGISGGRSTGIVMVTSFLDELFFALVFPLVVLLIGHQNIFGFDDSFASSFVYFAWLGYSIKAAYIIALSYGLFVNPQGLKKLLVLIFRLPFLRRWSARIEKIGNDLIETSVHFRHWPFRKWLKAFGATVTAWIARYWVVNVLVVAFFGISVLSLHEHFIVFGKQLAMWIMMLVSPTPGGSGFAEWVFKEFLANYIPIGTGVALALCWRLVSYYPYLIMGAIIVPRWVRRIVEKSNANAQS